LYECTTEGLQHELMQYEGGPANDENAGGAPQPLLLHGDECFLTVKWDSCPYAEVNRQTDGMEMLR